MGFILLIISLALRTEGAIQLRKDKGDVIGLYKAPSVVAILMVIWIVLLLGGLYLIYVDYGLFTVGGALVTYFIIMPTIFGTLYKK